MDNLPAPEIITREIVEDLTAALAEFEAVAAALEAGADGSFADPGTAGTVLTMTRGTVTQQPRVGPRPPLVRLPAAWVLPWVVPTFVPKVVPIRRAPSSIGRAGDF